MTRQAARAGSSRRDFQGSGFSSAVDRSLRQGRQYPDRRRIVPDEGRNMVNGTQQPSETKMMVVYPGACDGSQATGSRFSHQSRAACVKSGLCARSLACRRRRSATMMASTAEREAELESSTSARRKFCPQSEPFETFRILSLKVWLPRKQGFCEGQLLHDQPSPHSSSP